MPRPSQIDQQRERLLPIVCQVFSELGYQRTTTAVLATRCGVRENILYRLWTDKKGMFLAAIDDIFQARSRNWTEFLKDEKDPVRRLETLIEYESTHQGEFGFYRVVFTALSETDDPEIRAALVGMYSHFQKLVLGKIEPGRSAPTRGKSLSNEEAAWALMGLATISNIIRELKLLPETQRQKMFVAIAKMLVLGVVG